MAELPLCTSPSASQLWSSPLRHENYRPDIDGLRAIAVLAVIAYHAVPNLLPGGFVGVDVFFVISGFLISSIIFRELARGNFSWLVFYQRRAKRIFPALALMLLTIWVLAWPSFLWDEFQGLGRQIVAGAGFATNLFLYGQLNPYFGLGAATTPLLHLWSLGVEEQFYIVWPFVLIAVWRLSTGHARLFALVGIAALSFALNIATVGTNHTASFYLPWNRFWELAIGSAVAYATSDTRWRADDALHFGGWQLRSRSWLQSRRMTGTVGVAAIVASLCVLDGNAVFPGWWALAPCLGALLLISAGPEDWFNRHVLASRPMVFVGLISYPLYLWHWPLLSIAHIVDRGGQSRALVVSAVVAAFVLAVLTYKYVELPIRTSPRTSTVALSLCIAMAACGVLGYATMTGRVQARSQSYPLDRYIVASREDWLTGSQRDWTLYPDGFLRFGTGARTTLFVGDSNMQQYYPRIAKLLEEHPQNARAATFAVRAGCAPAVIDLLESSRETAACRAFLDEALRYAKSPQVDTVVIGAFWRRYAAYDWRKVGASTLKPNTDAVLADLQRVVADLVIHGKRVYVVLNIPISPNFDPRYMIRRRVLPPAFSVEVRSPPRAEVESSIAEITTKVAQSAQAAGAVVVDPLAFLCDESVCPAVTSEGDPMYRDRSHLRPSYVREHVRFLDETVLDHEVAAEAPDE